MIQSTQDSVDSLLVTVGVCWNLYVGHITVHVMSIGIGIATCWDLCCGIVCHHVLGNLVRFGGSLGRGVFVVLFVLG